MSVAELQLELHKAIDGITDSNKLKALNELLKGTPKSFKSMSKPEYNEAIDRAKHQISIGKSMDVDQLENESEGW